METKYTTLLERYFDQEASLEEIAKIEQLKKTDSNFLEEFELFEKANHAVKLSTIIDLKAEIKKIHKKQGSSTKNPVIIRLLKVGVAASILLIVGLGLYAQLFSNQQLYSEAYTPVGDYVTTMDNDLSEMDVAMKLYDNQQYDSASLLFNKIYTLTDNQVALFYSGHSLFQANKPEQAIALWNKISNEYRTEARWYIALAYLKMDDTGNTINVLNSIIENNRDEAFVLKAKKLKEKLQSPFRKLVLNR